MRSVLITQPTSVYVLKPTLVCIFIRDQDFQLQYTCFCTNESKYSPEYKCLRDHFNLYLRPCICCIHKISSLCWDSCWVEREEKTGMETRCNNQSASCLWRDKW
jgi:hypothetical protein